MAETKNRKTLAQMTEAEARSAGVSSLADKPNSASRYGDGGLTAAQLKARFDALPNLVREKFNKIAGILASEDAAKYITLDGSIGGIDNLYDFLRLFVYDEAGGTDEKIENYIKVLYDDVTVRAERRMGLQDVIYKISQWIYSVQRTLEKNVAELYDYVVLTEKEFDALLYPLFQNEDAISDNEAVTQYRSGTAALGTPDPDFQYKRILVRGVTFTRRHGYSDVRMHIFQPSIEYIKFEDCRWETGWRVSGKAPNELTEAGTQFKSAEGDLGLVIDGIEITAENIEAAREAGEYWNLGFRNIKSMINSSVHYPEGYDIAGEWNFKLTCQYFDHASNCKIHAFWDGANVSDCYIIEKLVRCKNCMNVVAAPVKNNGAALVVGVQGCENLSNFIGTFSFSGCKSISASKEDVAAAEANSKKFANETFVPLKGSTGLKIGEYFLYAVGLDDAGKTVQTRVHARSTAANNEMPLRTKYATILSSREWSSNNFDYSNTEKWSAATLMPRDYIDRQLKERAPLVDGKIPANYLPGFVDDTIEGHLNEDGSFTVTETDSSGNLLPEETKGKLYVDTNTKKIYRWSGLTYVEIAKSVVVGTNPGDAYDGADGAALAIVVGDLVNIVNGSDSVVGLSAHVKDRGNPHGVSAEQIGAVEKVSRNDTLGGILLYGVLQDDMPTTILASTSIVADKIPIRDANGHLQNSWPKFFREYENGNWGKGVCTPRDYVDRLVKGGDYTDPETGETEKVYGYAPLNDSGLIDSTYLPSYVDDVIEYDNLGAFPSNGEHGKIYVDTNTKKIYRWSGTTYVEIAKSTGTYTNEKKVPKAIGGISVGEKFDNVSFTEMFNKLLYPKTASSLSDFSLTPSAGIKEMGDTITLSSASVYLTIGDDEPTTIKLFQGATLLSTKTVSASGTITFTLPSDLDNVTSNATFDANLYDSAGVQLASVSTSYTFVYPVYYGTIAANTAISSSAIADGTKLTITKTQLGYQSIEYETSNSYPFIAYPANYTGTLTMKAGGFTYEWDEASVTIDNVAYTVRYGGSSSATLTYNFSW